MKLTQSKARLFVLGCLAVAGWFVYTAVDGAIRNHTLEQDRADAERAVASLHEKKVYIDAVKQYAASDTYVEQEARRKLGYIREGEIPFVVESPPLREDGQPAGEWWQRLFPR